MKTAISVPDDLFRSADTLADRLGISRSQLYATALAEYLAKHQARKVTERLDAVYRAESARIQTMSGTPPRTVRSDEW